MAGVDLGIFKGGEEGGGGGRGGCVIAYTFVHLSFISIEMQKV